MRSGDRNGRAKVFGRIAGLSLGCGSTQAPILTPLPGPLAALVSSDSRTELSVVASGLADPLNLRVQPDGSLVLDAPGESLEYRITPYPDGGAEVLLAAREMRDELIHASRVGATLVGLDWAPHRGTEAGDCVAPRETLEAAKALARVPRTEAALAPDGTLLVAALDAGIVYRVTLHERGCRADRVCDRHPDFRNVAELARSADAAPRDQVDDREQDHRAQEGHEKTCDADLAGVDARRAQ
jgi:hypothetical protein